MEVIPMQRTGGARPRLLTVHGRMHRQPGRRDLPERSGRLSADHAPRGRGPPSALRLHFLSQVLAATRRRLSALLRRRKHDDSGALSLDGTERAPASHSKQG